VGGGGEREMWTGRSIDLLTYLHRSFSPRIDIGADLRVGGKLMAWGMSIGWVVPMPLRRVGGG
jgi:hypothetical protein